MLCSHGAASLSGNNISRSSALVLNDSLVQYEGATLKLEHGGVAISTPKSLATAPGQ